MITDSVSEHEKNTEAEQLQDIMTTMAMDVMTIPEPRWGFSNANLFKKDLSYETPHPGTECETCPCNFYPNCSRAKARFLSLA